MWAITLHRTQRALPLLVGSKNSCKPQAPSAVHSSSQNISGTKGQLGTKHALFTPYVCTSSRSDRVIISGFTSLLWCRPPLAPSLIFIPKNSERVMFSFLFNHIAVSSGLAQYLLAIARYENSKLKWSWEQIIRGKKEKDQAGTPLHAAGGGMMREDACGGADTVFFPSERSFPAEVLKFIPVNKLHEVCFVPPQQQTYRLTCETVTTNLLTRVIRSSHTNSLSKSAPRSVKSQPLLSPFSFLMTPSCPPHPPPDSAHTPVLSRNFISSAPPNQQLGRRND